MDDDLLEDLESVTRQGTFTDRKTRHYNGVPEVNITDSGALSSYAEALRTLARHGRFRIVREHGRMVLGYWPENDPINLSGGVSTSVSAEEESKSLDRSTGGTGSATLREDIPLPAQNSVEKSGQL